MSRDFLSIRLLFDAYQMTIFFVAFLGLNYVKDGLFVFVRYTFLTVKFNCGQLIDICGQPIALFGQPISFCGQLYTNHSFTLFLSIFQSGVRSAIIKDVIFFRYY